MRPTTFRITPGKRVLFLTRDPALIARQRGGSLDLRMRDLSVADLQDDVNTDAMAPAWVCCRGDARCRVHETPAPRGLSHRSSRAWAASSGRAVRAA